MVTQFVLEKYIIFQGPSYLIKSHRVKKNFLISAHLNSTLNCGSRAAGGDEIF